MTNVAVKPLRIARFIGDPNGYRIHPDGIAYVPIAGATGGWLLAAVGVSEKYDRLINLNLAYVIEIDGEDE